MNFLRQELTGLGLIAAGSLSIGLLFNELRQTPLLLAYASPQKRLGRVVERLSAQPSTSEPGRNIDLGEVQERVSAHRSIVIDARPPGFYRAGHIPGAINLPRGDFEKVYPEVRALIEPAKDQEIIVYCAEADCRDSELVAGALSQLGCRQLLVYKEGWEEWARAGLPQATGQTP